MPYRRVGLQDIPASHPVAVFSEFWQSIAAGGSPVPWTLFDPVEHKDILPWLLLLKRSPGADPDVSQSWSYSVCGTGCTQLFGQTYQGKVFGESLPPSAVAERQAEIHQLVAGSGPLYSHTNLPIEDRDFVEVIRGVFPFTASGPILDCVLFVIARDDKELTLVDQAATDNVQAGPA